MVSQSVYDSEGAKMNAGNCGVNPCILGAGVKPAEAIAAINRLLADPSNHYGTPPKYGVTPADPGPVLYPRLTAPH